ncbi:perilipin-3-like [Apus apus]|uniref:perilipin-3-like n=1 Tax=Apus apus TaxID=8895 RepID=UPI0021F8D7B5|nr:perilipin-3-like [Apus apus]
MTQKELISMSLTRAATQSRMASEKTTKKDLLKAEEQQQASAVDRVTSFPLLNSAFNLVSSAYNYTKETHPCLSGVCNVAETVAAVAVGSVVGGAQPILNQLEPQIALVNEYACKGLDQLEENLPFLQQPADKVLSDTKQLVSTKVMSAMDAASAQGAKDLVTNKVTEAVDLTKGAVQDGVEKTKSVVTSTTNSVVTNSISKAKAVSQAVAGGAESVLGMSEDLVDHYLPMTEEELGKLATAVEGSGVASVEEQKQQKSYFVRLGSLSGQARRRALQHSLCKLQRLRKSTQDTLSRLQLAIELIESVKQEVGQKLLDGQEKLHRLWVDWSLTQPKGNQVKTACEGEGEARTLAMLRIITRHLQPAFENLKASTQGLPSHIQEAVYQATQSIHKLHRSFSNAMSFQDLSSTTLTQSQDCVAEARRSLDDLFEYVTQNTPPNWLVGPFRAIAKVSQGGRKEKKKERVTDTKSAMLEKATSSKEVAETPKEPKAAKRISGECIKKLAKEAAFARSYSATLVGYPVIKAGEAQLHLHRSCCPRSRDPDPSHGNCHQPLARGKRRFPHRARAPRTGRPQRRDRCSAGFRHRRWAPSPGGADGSSPGPVRSGCSYPRVPPGLAAGCPGPAPPRPCPAQPRHPPLPRVPAGPAAPAGPRGPGRSLRAPGGPYEPRAHSSPDRSAGPRLGGKRSLGSGTSRPRRTEPSRTEPSRTEPSRGAGPPEVLQDREVSVLMSP